MTVNLGPTFLSGALAANAGDVMDEPSCPLVQGPYRHYVLNVIWISINGLSILLTVYHLHRLYKDYTRWTLQGHYSLVSKVPLIFRGPNILPAAAESVRVNKLYNGSNGTISPAQTSSLETEVF